MTSDYLVGRTAEEGQRHGTFGRAGAKLLRHVCQAVPKSTSLVNDSLCNELTFPPLVIARRPPRKDCDLECKSQCSYLDVDLDYDALELQTYCLSWKPKNA